jgi:hypothetical protein
VEFLRDARAFEPRPYQATETHCVLPSDDSRPSRLPASASFRDDPLPDIGRTTVQPDAFHLAARQETHRIAIDESYVSHVQSDGLAGRLQMKEPLQLGNVLNLDSAT